MIEKKHGFTIIEMLVVVSIFMVITGIILFNAPQFRERVSIDLIANDLALVVRSAQTYGMATRKSNVIPEAFPSYGFYLSVLSDVDTDPLIYIYPVEDVENPAYFNDDNNFEEKYKLPNGFFVESICVRDDNNNCATSDQLHVAFIRPELKATICSSDSCDSENSSKKAEIVIKSIKEDSRRIISVYQNGQIAVENYNG